MFTKASCGGQHQGIANSRLVFTLLKHKLSGSFIKWQPRVYASVCRCTRLADMLPLKYKDNTLQIEEKSTERTAPFFVLGVTAHSAADILGIYLDSVVMTPSSWTKAISADST